MRARPASSGVQEVLTVTEPGNLLDAGIVPTFGSTFRVMGGSVSCRVGQPSSAEPVTVYDVLMDFERWPAWMPTVSAASWEQRGAPDTGVGGIRRVRVGPSVTHDQIVEGARPHHHAYVVALPWYTPLKDYRGDVRIEKHPSGSLITWTASCTPRIPFLANLFQSRLQATYTRLVAALAQEAERIGGTKEDFA
jgi:Polyketide cyclase / dehydrase and lipid transport